MPTFFVKTKMCFAVALARRLFAALKGNENQILKF